jgi:hypothetical protein
MSELGALLLRSVGRTNRDAVRLCAVQWANRIYTPAYIPVRGCVLASPPYVYVCWLCICCALILTHGLVSPCALLCVGCTNHLQARWIGVLGVSDTKAEVREEAARGLRLHAATLEPLPAADTPAAASTPASSRASEPNLPSLEQLMQHCLRCVCVCFWGRAWKSVGVAGKCLRCSPSWCNNEYNMRHHHHRLDHAGSAQT